jgi:2-hydroxychromene-2-carboxylate isomerase
VPLLAFPPAKTRYLTLEMARWARWWGAPFDMPAKFPQRTIAAQRLALLAADDGPATGLRLAHALGRAMWAEQRDLEDEATLRAILRAEGLPEGWLARTQEPELKARLAANTAAAKAAGVFGVPTFVVSSGALPGRHLFWGQDRLELVARALAGRAWTPA